MLMPDGVNFDYDELDRLDFHLRQGMNAGMKHMVLRVVPAGSAAFPFGDANTDNWPVDPDEYPDLKNGEYLGPKFRFGLLKLWSYPPRVLTRDEPGNTSPWYDFVSALAQRYDGNTPDPLNPGEFLPRVDYWQCVEEPDVKSYWYGTATEYFGGVGGDPQVGTLPSFYRAIKDVRPDAVVVGGGNTSHEAGLYLAYEKGVAAGNVYDESVRAFGRSYFDLAFSIASLFDLWANNDEILFEHFDTDKEAIRSRGFFDALFDAHAHYDVIAAHFYDNHQHMEEVVNLYRSRTPFGTQVWLTEYGVVDAPGLGQPSISQEEHAYRTIKGLTIGMGLGVEHMAYTPVMAFPRHSPLVRQPDPAAGAEVLSDDRDAHE